MDSTGRFLCRTCGEWHEGPPFAWAFHAPAYWSDDLSDDETSVLGEEQCILRDEHFFVRAIVRLPVRDAEEDFDWGVWVSLSRENFERMGDLWETPGREHEPPMFGWLSSDIPIYDQSTLSLPTSVLTQPVGSRPLVVIEDDTHQLAKEQREGIDLARVQDFAQRIGH